MKLLSSILVVLLSGSLVLTETYEKRLYQPEEHESLFEEFIQTYQKVYKDEQEKQTRFEIFKQKLQQINELNARNEHAVFGINMFTDYSEEEARTLKCLAKPTDAAECKVIQGDKHLDANDDDKFDWREHNAVTSVKDQGVCGSCYAFSTIGNIEGQLAIKTKELVDLSPQQIVDCDKRNQGCGGGTMANAMSSIMDMGGLMTENDYPYTAAVNQCAFDESKVKAKLLGCMIYDITDENKIQSIVKNVGPISVAIAADSVQSYTKGIMTDGCNTQVNHAVLLVGYGSENGVPYWIVKNSWGANWGEQGYFRIKRGINSLCVVNPPGFTTSASLK